MYIIYIANDPVWLTSCLQIWHNMSHLSRCCHEVPEPQPIPIHGSFGELDVCLSHLLIYIYIFMGRDPQPLGVVGFMGLPYMPSH